jgi:outer membrane protein assembly factor BamB/formylglycine-generating enzyme required for sulfatase activity
MVSYRCRIVDYGADVGGGYYRTGGPDWQRRLTGVIDEDGDGDKSDDALVFVPFSLTEPVSPPFPRYDTDAVSAVFYGGITARFANRPAARISEGMLNENHELRDDFNMMLWAQQQTQTVRGWGLWFWQKRDFLNGGDRCRVTFDEASRIVPHVSRYWNGLDEGRWVVRDGGAFWISEQTFGGVRKSHVLHPVNTRWARYSPAEPHDIAFDAAPATFVEHDFEDVTAVGFYVARNRARRGGVELKWHSFEAYAVVHRPETPSFHAEMVRTGAGDRATWLGRTEVPYRLWRTVWRWAVSNQYCFDLEPGYVFDQDGDMGSMKLGSRPHQADEPVTNITWHDAVLWCNALSELEGRTPCYYADAEHTQVLRIVKGRDDPADWGRRYAVHVKWSADGYRLPTQGEWLAAAAGARTDAAGAWTAANADGTTHAVGTRAASPAGLCDMLGNVWEFCWDIDTGSFDPDRHDSHTVLGGDFLWPADPSRASPLPYGERPWSGSYRIGLRIARAAAPDAAAIPAEAGPKPAGDTPVWTFTRQTVVPPVPQVGKPQAPALGLVKLPAGSFVRHDEAKVTLSPFAIGRTEVSYATWNAVHQWALRHGYVFDADGDMGSMDHQTGEAPHSPDEPVTDITWEDAALWCNALSEMTGRTPCYTTDPERTKVYRRACPWRVAMWRGPQYARAAEGWLRLHVRWHADGFRLPTEAEWEYAFRAGVTAMYARSFWQQKDAKGRDRHLPERMAEFGWVAANADDRTHPCGTRKPNGFGLHDMVGNVSEFTWDWPGYDYYRCHDPRGARKWNMFGKVVRGSNFGSREPTPAFAKVQELPGVPRPIYGFRVVRCEAGVHPEVDTFTPKVVLDVDARDYDPLQGRVFGANLRRTGVFETEGVPKLGGLRWKSATGGPVRSSPVAVDGVVYVGSGDGHVYALSASDGKPLWKFQTGGPVVGPPAVVAGAVYVGSDDRHLYAIDAATGKLRWKFRRHHRPVQTAPAVAFGLVFAGFGTYSNGGLSGLDVATGKERWRYRYKGMNRGPLGPAIEGTTVYAAAEDISLFAADLPTEQPVWQTHGPPCRASMAVGVRCVFHAGVGMITAYDKKTGERVWRVRDKDNPQTDRNPTSSPALWDGRLIVGRKSGQVLALDAASGRQLWAFSTGGPVFSSPAIAGASVYVGSDDAHVYALDARTGRLLWKFATGGCVRSSPWPGQGVVFVGSDDGVVYALGGP